MYFNQKEKSSNVLSPRNTVEKDRRCLSHTYSKKPRQMGPSFYQEYGKIVRETNDEHLHVIIHDFDSGDIDRTPSSGLSLRTTTT